MESEFVHLLNQTPQAFAYFLGMPELYYVLCPTQS